MADRGHEVLEHTADVGLHIWAPTLEEVFAEAAVALVALMGTGEGPGVTQDVAIDAPDVDALFVDWLNEVLFLFEVRQVVTRDARVRIDRDCWTLAATIDGVRADSFEQGGAAVKAVTFHGLEVSETHARVYLDV